MSKFIFIDAEKASYPVKLMCRLLKVSRSGYYAWRQRPASLRAIADEVLTVQITELHDASRKTYGAPRIHLDLTEAGIHVGRKRVARLMRLAGLQGAHRRGWRKAGTRQDPSALPAPDLVNRQFSAGGPDRLWVAGVTYVPTIEGWLYLAIVLDVFSRRVIGWSMDSHRKSQLVCDAISMAVTNRGGQVTGVIHHSDRGGEYTSYDIEKKLRGIEALASMGSVADCYDSMAEAFFATLETELFWAQPGRRFDSHREAKLAIFDYIEVFYNCQRRHTSIGGIAPITFEQRYLHAADLAA